jgi:hypothetical protein
MPYVPFPSLFAASVWSATRSGAAQFRLLQVRHPLLLRSTNRLNDRLQNRAVAPARPAVKPAVACERVMLEAQRVARQVTRSRATLQG